MTDPAGPVPMKVVPLRHWGRWVASALVLLALGLLVAGLVVNHNIAFPTVRHYFFNPLILRGVRTTIILAVVSQAVGIAFGIVLASMRRSPNPALSGTSWLYIWFFRGTPLLVQLIFWAYFGSVYFHLDLGIPFTHAVAASTETSTILTNYRAAFVGLALNEAAYMAEIVRGGFLAVPDGQTEAALSLGMRGGLTLRRIVLPQAIRVIIPATGNEFTSMIKNTSLVSVIGGMDLFTNTQTIYNNNLKVIPLLVVASLWYLVITSVLAVGQYYLERHYARGGARSLPPTPRQRLLATVRTASR